MLSEYEHRILMDCIMRIETEFKKKGFNIAVKNDFKDVRDILGIDEYERQLREEDNNIQKSIIRG